MHIKTVFAACLTSLASATAASPSLASLDCAGLERAAAALQQEQLALFSKPMSDPTALGQAMNRIGQRGGEIQTQREKKKCAGATIDKNDLGK